MHKEKLMQQLQRRTSVKKPGMKKERVRTQIEERYVMEPESKQDLNRKKSLSHVQERIEKKERSLYENIRAQKRQDIKNKKK